MTDSGQIVILNGTPRSGKSGIASAIQESSGDLWMNLGVDAFSGSVTPSQYRPGIGLRPGGGRPDLEARLPVLFDALYGSVVTHSRLGLNVVVDVGHHDDYSTPLGILGRVAELLADTSAYFVGVRCPVEVIMGRRDVREPGREGRYVKSGPDGTVPDVVLRWEQAVHDPGIYDVEVDTSVQSPEVCAEAIQARLEAGRPTAFAKITEHFRQD